MRKQFAVIGLGRFGASIVKTLIALGHEVMAIDKNDTKVNNMAEVATTAVQIDSTEEQSLKDIGIRNFDHVVVAIGDDIQASILTTLLLKDLGVEYVTVKASNEYHLKVLHKIGADRIVQPERDMGTRIAHHLLSKNVIDYIELSPDYSLVEVQASGKMCNKTLEELQIRAKYGCTVMAVKQEENTINISPRAEDKISEGDILIVVGSNKDINSFEESL